MSRSVRAAVVLRQAVLLLVAALPALLVLLLLHRELRADRRAELETRLRLHAAMLDDEIAEILQSGRQLGHVLLALPTVRGMASGCSAELGAMLENLPPYAAIAVVDGAGRVVCAAPYPPRRDTAAPGVVARHLALMHSAFSVGVFAAGGGRGGPGLPLALPFRTAEGRTGTLVLTLSLDWLSRHLVPHAAASSPAGAVVTVADANGVVLAREPDGGAFIGQKLPPGLAQHLGGAGTIQTDGLDGEPQLVAFRPAGGGRLFVAAGLPPPGLLAGAERLGWRGGAVLVGGVMLSLWLLMVLSARMERRPATALVRTAQRWSAGELDARARVDEVRDGVFARLAGAFNGMAEALGRQRAELLALNASLEQRVAARTGELEENRDRLKHEVAEREKAEAELRQAQKLQAVGQLAGGIAHDFNNLLAGLTSALELMRRRLSPPVGAPESGVSLDRLALLAPLESAMQAARRGVRLTGQLLAFARRQRLLPAPTDLNRLVAELPALVAGSLGREIAITTELAAGLWPAFVDPGQLEAALLNLVLNARDAMPAGGVLTLSTANVMLPEDLPTGPTLAPGAYVAVRVADTGAGIAPEVLARVFEPFFTTKPAGSASGLGLSQVHGVALQSGGDVRIDSTPDSGTTVTLLLPRAAPRGARPAREAPRDLRILVADDDNTVRRMTGEILIERGHHPVLAADAAEALAILEKDRADTGGSFDVLLADYMMPGTNGAALILMAQALQPRMRALLVTGHAEFGVDEKLRPEHIMRKPFTIAELDRRLAELVGEEV